MADNHTQDLTEQKECVNEARLPHYHGETADLSAIQKILSQTEDFQIIADVFRQMGDTSRTRIFWMLCHVEECVTNIAALMNMSSPAISHHLRALKDSGLISSRREGKEVYYHASETPQSHLLHQMIEQVMEVSCPDLDKLPEDLNHAHKCAFHCNEQFCSAASVCQHPEQADSIRQIHDMLTSNLDKRWNVEELARIFLMNPTTLKIMFKEMYGVSIAAHIKEHRMEKAAEELLTTDNSIADIAASVGYSSQSKFTAAFKEHFGILPKDYRKIHTGA